VQTKVPSEKPTESRLNILHFGEQNTKNKSSSPSQESHKVHEGWFSALQVNGPIYRSGPKSQCFKQRGNEQEAPWWRSKESSLILDYLSSCLKYSLFCAKVCPWLSSPLLIPGCNVMNTGSVAPQLGFLCSSFPMPPLRSFHKEQVGL